jgi:YbbR domain-containing protein
LKKVNILIWALSLVIAAVLWGVVAFYLNPESEKVVRGIPVDFINESALTSSDLMLIGGNDATVDVRFAGRTRHLANVNENVVRAEVDLRNVRTAGEILMAFNLRGGDVNFLASYPFQDNVTVTIDRRVGKFIDLRLDFAGEIAEGFMRDPAVFYPARIEISGPSKKIDSIHEAVVRYDPPEPLSRSVSDLPISYDFYTEDGQFVANDQITADFPDVRLTMPVIMVKTIPLDIGLIPGGGLTEALVDVEIDPKSVRIAGDPELLESINSIQIDQINLAPLLDSFSETIVIRYPDGVRNLDYIDEAHVSVKINVPTREVHTTNITVQGLELPNEYIYSIITTPVSVTLRGPAEYLDRVAASNVRVVADFTDAEITAAGRLRRPALVFVDGFDAVGAIDLGYEVTIEIVPLTIP